MSSPIDRRWDQGARPCHCLGTGGDLEIVVRTSTASLWEVGVAADREAPWIHVRLTPDVLRPANHRLVPITAQITVRDDMDAHPRVVLVSIVASDTGRGPGNIDPDIVGARVGTDDREFMLRAEHPATGNGRTYVVTYRAIDKSGNSRVVRAAVTVPPDYRY